MPSKSNRDAYVRLSDQQAVEIRAVAEANSVSVSQVIAERLLQWEQWQKKSSKELPGEADRLPLEELASAIHELRHDFYQRMDDLEARLNDRLRAVSAEVDNLRMLKLHLDRVEGVAHGILKYCEIIMVDVVSFGTDEDKKLRQHMICQVQNKLIEDYYPERLHSAQEES